MSCKYVGIVTVLVMATIVGCAIVPCDNHLQYANMRKLFADLLSEYRCDFERKERVLCAKDVDEAIRIFDKFLFPTMEDKSELRIRRLRNRIKSRMSWVYCTEGGDGVAYYLLNLFPEFCYGRYGFNYFVRYFPENEDGLRENHGFLELKGSDVFRERRDGGYAYGKACSQFPRIVENPDDATPIWGFESCDIVLVVDVVDVQLMNVGGFDRVRLYPSSTEECVAEYSIRMDIRSAERGLINAESLFLTARRRWLDFGCGSWLYYRGMTLRIGLRSNGSDYSLVNVLPVMPYEPFSEEDVFVSGGGRIGKDWKEFQEGKMASLMVQYGSHTKVEFVHGDIVNCGPCGSFPDFGITSRVKVVELLEGSNREYWEDAWFLAIDECHVDGK